MENIAINQHAKSVKLQLLSCEQISSIFTTLSPDTVRHLACVGRLPVAHWMGHQPYFHSDVKTIRALLEAKIPLRGVA